MASATGKPVAPYLARGTLTGAIVGGAVGSVSLVLALGTCRSNFLGLLSRFSSSDLLFGVFMWIVCATFAIGMAVVWGRLLRNGSAAPLVAAIPAAIYLWSGFVVPILFTIESFGNLGEGQCNTGIPDWMGYLLFFVAMVAAIGVLAALVLVAMRRAKHENDGSSDSA